MVNRLYRWRKAMILGLILGLLCLSDSLSAQNDIVKDMDSLRVILEQKDSTLQDSIKPITKPLPIIAPNNDSSTNQRAANEKTITGQPATKKQEASKQAKPQLEPEPTKAVKQAQADENEAKEVDSVINKGKDTLKEITGLKSKKDKDLSSVESEESPQDKLEKISDLVSGDNIFYSIIFLLFGYAVVKVLSFVLNALAERSPSYRIAFKGAIPIIKIATWVIIITLIIVVVFRPSITTMLAFSASIGVAVGFASQDILKNIFGGIVILLDRPFVSGDKIEVDKYYGEVVEIGLRSTRIVTPDDSLVSVPNAVMMSGSVSNANSGELNCQVVAEIYLPNDVDTQEARDLATEAASVSKYIYLGKPITILFFHEMNQTKSFLKMKVKAYVMDTRDEFKFKSDMTELIIKEFVRKGVL